MTFYAFYPPTNIVTATIVGPVSVTQGTSPWVVAGTVTANQGTNPWTVNGTVNAAQSGTWNIGTLTTITNPVTVNQGTSPWIISGSTTVTGTVTANQGTSPWVVSGTVAATQSGTWTTGRTWTLSNSTDSIAAVQSGTWNINNITGTVSLPTGASTSANQTSGAQKTQVVDGAGTVIGPAQTISGTNYLPVVLAASATPGSALVARSIQVAGSDGANARTLLTDTSGNLQVVGNVANAAADSGNPVKIGGVFNSTAPTYTTGQRADRQVDSTGALFVNRESQKSTYSAAVQFTIAANPTDVFTITGSGTKLVRLVKLSISGTNTGNTNAVAFLTRRSSANSAGTSTTATNVVADSTQSAATATIRSYTANPTLGTTVGNFRVSTLFLPTLASTNQNVDIEFEFGNVNNKSIVLRGTSEVIAVNFAGTAITGTTSLSIDITWTEE